MRCNRYPTQHKCLVKVASDALLFEGCIVCSAVVCSKCKSKFEIESIYCAEHLSLQSEKDTVSAVRLISLGKTLVNLLVQGPTLGFAVVVQEFIIYLRER